jgi:hypothetical protein
MALAYWIAMWPRPPTPLTTNQSPGLQSATLIPLYTVTPAQTIGPAEIGSSPAGIRATYAAGAAQYSAKPPFAVYPPYVAASHIVSRLVRQ